jgi:RND superfamily putative drug exporter
MNPPADEQADKTTAIPTARPNGSHSEDAAATTAIPVANPRTKDTEAATEKLNSRPDGDGDDKPTRRGGGGVSAQDLLRREGRI